jgi:hypothetical protein
MVIPDDFLDSAQARRLVEICEALAAIQRHTFAPVRVPDFTAVTTETALEWIQIAQLLRGEVLKGTWEAMPVTLRPGIDFPTEDQEPFSVALPSPLAVTISGTVIPLGEQIIHVRAARLDRGSFTKGSDGQRNVTLVPASDNTLTVQWKSANDTGLGMTCLSDRLWSPRRRSEGLEPPAFSSCRSMPRVRPVRRNPNLHVSVLLGVRIDVIIQCRPVDL